MRFYAIVVFLAAFGYGNQRLTNEQPMFPLWSIFWARWVSYNVAVAVVRSLYVLGSLAGALFPLNLMARLAVFLGILEYHAFISSFEQPNHQMYPWLYTAFILLFLPRNSQTVGGKRMFLLVVWAAQAFFLLTYSMGGVSKLYWAVVQTFRGDISAFHPMAFAYQIAGWMIQAGEAGILGGFILKHPWVGWFPYLLMIYLQTFALLAAFRPRLHRLWAWGLVCFHIGTQVTMGIYFYESILLLLVLFFDTPFAPRGLSWRDIFDDLPLFGILIRKLRRKQIARVSGSTRQ